MAKKNTATPKKVYSRVLNIRLSEDEYRQLQENASKKGLQISTAVRLALFGEKEIIINTYADSDWKYKLLLAVQECRSSFKKISVRINNAVTVYDRSVDERDDEGRKLLSTTQTIRHITGLTNTLMEMQKSLNVVLEMMNAQPVHSAAWPSPEARVGKLMSEERSKMMPAPCARLFLCCVITVYEGGVAVAMRPLSMKGAERAYPLLGRLGAPLSMKGETTPLTDPADPPSRRRL